MKILGGENLYILSGTIYTTTGLLLMLAAFIWYYFWYNIYAPLIVFSLLFLSIGGFFYYLEYKKTKVNKERSLSS